MKPQDLILRCYGYETPENNWVLKCVDLAIVVEENSIEAAKKSLEDAIISYLEVVYDTEDKESIPKLLKRKSPLIDILRYHTLAFIFKIYEIKSKLVFEEAIPIRPVVAC